MSYLTQSDYETRFGVAELLLIADPQDSGSVDPLTFAAAADAASALIDAHLATRYTLPMASVPILLVDAAADLTRERLHGDRVSELILERARQARRLLADIAAGRVTLTVADAPLSPSVTGGGAPTFRPGLTTLTDALKDY